MIFPTWKFELDDGDDFTFSADHTTRMIRFKSRIGMERIHDHVAPPSWCEIVLDNSAGSFVIGTNIKQGRWARIQATYNSVTYDVYTGLIEYMTVDLAGDTCALTLRGQWMAAQATRMPFSLRESIRTDQVIDLALNKDAVFRGQRRNSGNSYWWAIVNDINAKVNSCCTWGADTSSDLDTGARTLTYVGDVFDEPTTLAGVVTDAAMAECGFFYEDQSQVFQFRNRTYYAVPPPTRGTYTRDTDGVFMAYQGGSADYVNYIEAIIHPRFLDEQQTVFTNDNPYYCPPGITEIEIVARATNGLLLGIKNPYLKGRLLTFTGGSDGSGSSYMPRVGHEYTSFGVILTIYNKVGVPFYLLAGTVQITGQPLIQSEAVVVRAQNRAEVNWNGRRGLVLDLRSVHSLDTAREIVDDYAILHAQESHGEVRYIEIQPVSGSRLGDALATDLYDFFNLNPFPVGQGFARDYAVTAIEHEVTPGATMVSRFHLSIFEED